MYNNFLSIIALVLLSLTIFLSGCGEDAEETLASINLPISFAPAISQGEYSVKITITGPGIVIPIIKTQTLTVQPGSDQAYEIIVDNIPADNNRSVKVEISKDGKVLFEGAETVYLSSAGANSLSIKVSPLEHDLAADFEVKTRSATYRGNILRNGNVEVDASKSYDTHYDIEVAWDWGDGEKTDFGEELTAKHTYQKGREYTITLTVRNKTTSVAVEKRSDSMEHKVEVKPFVSLSITTYRDDIQIGNRTEIFKSSDEISYTCVNYYSVPVNTKYLTLWTWYDPRGTIYRTASKEFPAKPQMQNCSWCHGIYIKGQRAANLLGKWIVKVRTSVYASDKYIGFDERSANFSIEKG